MPSLWQEYLDAGWALAELRPGSKAPRVDGWQKKGAPFSLTAMGAGLVHEHSGTCAVDIDDMQRAQEWLAKRDVAIADLFNAEDRVQLIGNPKNHGKLLYRLPTARRSKKVVETIGTNAEGKPIRRNVIDFRCAGNQDVLPPSLHPETGAPYAWNYGDPLLGHWSILPELPSQLDAIWAEMIGPATTAPLTPNNGSPEVSVDDLLAWLDKQDADTDRDSWVGVGMRIHQATGGQGFYIWDNWSRKGEKYNDTNRAADMAAAWRSFKLGGGLGTGPILAEKVAKAEDFPIEPPSEFDPSVEPTDNSVGARAHRLLIPRLIFLSGQGRYYFLPGDPPVKGLDEHADCTLPNNESVNVMFTSFMPEYRTKQGGVTRRAPTEYLKEIGPQKVSNLGFHPGEGRIYTDVDGLRYLNRFTPDTVEALQPTCGELEAWEFLIRRIHDVNYRRWLMQFYAYILKYPGRKVMSAPLLYSNAPGTGKSTLMKLVPMLLYGKRWVRTVSSDTLSGRFTSVLADAWFVVLDELKTNGGKLDRIHLANKMKPWITEPDLEIERKGQDPYTIRNRLQITATSNYDDAVQIEDDDRRWGVSELSGETMSEAEAADLFLGFLSTPRAAGVLKHIFERVDIVGFNPAGQAPRTAGRTVMVSAGLGPWVVRLVEAAASRTAPFDRDIVSLENVRDLLLGLGAPALRAVAGLLKRPPFSATLLRDRNSRLYCWRNNAQWDAASPSERHLHVETGAYPAGSWSIEVPVAIRRMAGDDTVSDDSSDLLGSING